MCVDDDGAHGRTPGVPTVWPTSKLTAFVAGPTTMPPGVRGGGVGKANVDGGYKSGVANVDGGYRLLVRVNGRLSLKYLLGGLFDECLFGC